MYFKNYGSFQRSHVPGSTEADPQLDTNVALKLLETLTVNDKLPQKARPGQKQVDVDSSLTKTKAPIATSALQLSNAAFSRKGAPSSSSALTLSKPSMFDTYLESDDSNQSVSTIDEDQEST